LPPVLARWLHIPFTSYDVLDSGRALQYIRAHRQVLAPSVKEVISLLAAKVREFANQVQIGRTHGQHALPITVGFWLATILNRVMANFVEMDRFASDLVGKISGAVGAKNAQIGLQIEEHCRHTEFHVGEVFPSFEERVLQKVGLEPAKISTQVLPPEPLAYYLFSCAMLSATLAQFGRDCRHLMRSEIGEVVEEKEEGAVGSSTMAHKTNPIHFENLEGQWLKTKNEFGKVLDCLISEHQRDLVGSAVARDFPVILVNLQTQLDTVQRVDKKGRPFIERIVVNRDACARNMAAAGSLVLAEPIYIALQMAGFEGDAHKLINDVLVPVAKAGSIPLIAAVEYAAEEDPSLKTALENIPSKVYRLFRAPELYIGCAAEKANEIADSAMKFLASTR